MRPPSVPTFSIATALLVCCAPPARAQQSLALTDVTVIDGTGAPARRGMTVLVEGDRISAIFPVGSRSLRPDTRQIDVAGSYVIPGLIDAHVHLATFERPANILSAILRFALLGGVTSVRDMGGNAERVLDLARAAEPAAALSPRIYASAVFAGPRWFAEYDSTRLAFWSGRARPGTAPSVRQIDDSTDLAAAVRAAAALGVRGIKLYSDIPPVRVAEIGRLARGAGMAVWTHAVVPPSRPDDLVASGATSFSHSDQLIWSAMPAGAAGIGDRAERARLLTTVRPDSPALQPLFASMIRGRVMLEPTLIVMQMGDIVDGKFGALGPIQAWAVAAARAAHRAGVPIVAGTDAIGQRVPYIHTELQLLVQQVGLTPLEAIQAATQHGARALGIEESTGTIAVGKAADLVVLRADPSADIRNTQTVRYVIRGGVAHERTIPWQAAPGAVAPDSTKR